MADLSPTQEALLYQLVRDVQEVKTTLNAHADRINPLIKTIHGDDVLGESGLLASHHDLSLAVEDLQKQQAAAIEKLNECETRIQDFLKTLELETEDGIPRGILNKIAWAWVKTVKKSVLLAMLIIVFLWWLIYSGNAALIWSELKGLIGP